MGGVLESDTTAQIIAKAQAAHDAGGGIVKFPGHTFTMTQSLPILAGVKYWGVEPVLAPVNPTNLIYLGDMEWNYVSGTVLVGNGAFNAFEGNKTDLASVPSDIENTAISSAGIINIGLDGFVDGVRVGAVNTMGMVWGEVRNVYAKNCSGWGVFLANFQHLDIDNIRTTLCQNGQYYGALLPGLTMMPGNSDIVNLFNMPPRDGRNRRLCRGIVFEAGGVASMLNQLNVSCIQCNAMSRTILSTTATFTNGSRAITVPSGAEFLPGMPVVFTATGAGFVAGQGYIVASVVGNTITLANDRVSSPISATAGITLTLETYGFPNMEITRRNSGARVQNSRFKHVDVEGSATAALYTEGCYYNHIEISELPGTMHLSIMARDSARNEYYSFHSGNTDFDGASTASTYFGARKATYQRGLAGAWIDESAAAGGNRVMAIGGGQNNGVGGDIHTRSLGFLYPNAGLGQRVTPRDNSITLSGANVGAWVFAGGTAQTWNLPTIADTTWAVSMIGAVYEIFNVGAAAVTLNTAGGQTFNNIAGKTRVAISPGAALRVTAGKYEAGTFFWLAVYPTMVT
ncbi:hypothetical protein [Arthrobacter sp. 35W]|uniref:hypothetical protein n=1 Tax=Arthrobacter sp. 35W TaxID=1132441 RepID=UPI000478EC5A|nr:hypothetical protein [Arthrobacter sp. 35W]